MIDSKLQARLRERFNPDGSMMRNVQLRMLKMLEFVDKICSENNITFWLSSGTCLGAVRHGGFIPWDDDVDIEMLEEDYIKLCKIMGNTPKGDYILQTKLNEPTYIYPFAKLRDLESTIKENGDFDDNYHYRGLFIDIFHLKPSNSYWVHKFAGPLHFRSINYNNILSMRYKTLVFKFLKTLAWPLLNIIDNIKSTTRYRHALGSYFHAPRDLNDLVPTKRIPFEGLMLPVPNNYNSYLSKIYGDYMKLPDLTTISSHLTEVNLK